MIAASVTGVALDRIAVVSGDTDEIAHSQLTAGSRAAQLAGSAVHSAASRLVELAREQAAELLEAAPADVVLDAASGQFHVAGSPRPRVSWAELAAQVAVSALWMWVRLPGRWDGRVRTSPDFTQPAQMAGKVVHQPAR